MSEYSFTRQSLMLMRFADALGYIAKAIEERYKNTAAILNDEIKRPIWLPKGIKYNG